MMDSNTDLERLYKRFIAEMNQPLSSRYYELDELLDIFDYASDLADDAVRMEVVLIANRLYPGNIDIAERKATLYWSMGNNAASAKVMDTIAGKHFLTRLTKMRIEKGRDGLDGNDLSRLVKGVKPGHLADEEVIQLIETAEDSGAQQWLVDNYELLKKLAQYPETVMYDIVEPVIDWVGGADFEFVNRVLDDLTMASPYDLGYWEFAAEVAMAREKNPERALGYIEYALAIDPKSVKSLVMKSECLLHLDAPKVDDALAAAGEAYRLDHKYMSACLVYTHALHASNRDADAMEVLLRYLSTPGCNVLVLPTMVKLDGALDVGTLLRAAVKNVEPSELEHQLDELLSKFMASGEYEFVAQTMEVIEEAGYVHNYKAEFLVELYFRTDRWEKTLPYLKECLTFDHRTWLLALIMSLPSVDREEDVAHIDSRIEALNDTIAHGTLSEVLEARAVKAYALMIRKSLVCGEEFVPERYCPFINDIPMGQI